MKTLDELKKEAKELGIQGWNFAKDAKKLQEKIDKAKFADSEPAPAEVADITQEAPQTIRGVSETKVIDDIVLKKNITGVAKIGEQLPVNLRTPERLKEFKQRNII